MSCRSTQVMNGYVIFKDMIQSMIHQTGGLVQHEDRFYRMACFAEGHV